MRYFPHRLSINKEILPALCFTAVLLLSACQTTPPASTVAPSPKTLSPLPELPVKNAVHYNVDSEETDMLILVYRGGPLARYGHNHVIAVRKAAGDIYLAKDFHQSAFALHFPVAALEVDPPAARADEGDEFATQPSAQAIEGTRKNMLGPGVLDGDNYPEIEIRSAAVTGPEWGPEVTVQISLHGVTREYTVPIALDHSGQRLTATGMLVLRTTAFNMIPFSVLGGGLQVQDEVKIRFRIVANKT